MVANTRRCVSRTVFQKGVVTLPFQYVCSYNATSLRAEFKIILNVPQSNEHAVDAQLELFFNFLKEQTTII